MTYGPFYLLDNPPASQQFWPSRNNGISGGVVIHTTEGSGGFDSAENTAAFIARRSDPGSYHLIVDCQPNAAVSLLPDDYVAFGVAASGYNSRCWMIAIAARSSDLDASNPDTLTEIDNAGREIAEYWQRNGIDAGAAAQFIGEAVKDQPGLAHHGDVQSWDRSDAWSRRSDRAQFDALLIDAILRHAGAPAPGPFVPVPPTPDPAGSVWGPGSTGDKVREIQRIVGVADDGIYGPQTEAAVRQWQANLGINADGWWGPVTEQATHDLFVFLSNLTVVQEIAPDNDFFRAVNDARQQIIQQGSNGFAVKVAQVTLNGRGYTLVGDGIFGPRTDAAVRSFQSDNGLAVDGIIGPDTWNALLS